MYQLHVEQMVRNGNRIALTEQRTLKKTPSEMTLASAIFMWNYLLYSSCIQITVASYQFHVEQMIRFDCFFFCVLTPLSAIFQLYHGDQF